MWPAFTFPSLVIWFSEDRRIDYSLARFPGGFKNDLGIALLRYPFINFVGVVWSRVSVISSSFLSLIVLNADTMPFSLSVDNFADCCAAEMFS